MVRSLRRSEGHLRGPLPVPHSGDLHHRADREDLGRDLTGTGAQPPLPQFATTAAAGGITAATTLMTTAAGTDQKRTTFHASTMSSTHVPISRKYAFFRPGDGSPSGSLMWPTLRRGRTSRGAPLDTLET